MVVQQKVCISRVECYMHSRLSRCSTARVGGPDPWYNRGVTLRGEGGGLVSHFHSLRKRRLLVKLSGLVKSVTKMVTECCKKDKSCFICSTRIKGLLVKYEKCGTLSMQLILAKLCENKLQPAQSSK